MALTRSCKMAICLATRQPTGRYSWVCVRRERERVRGTQRDRASQTKREKERVGGERERQRCRRVGDRAAPATHFIISISASYPLFTLTWINVSVLVCVKSTRIITLTNKCQLYGLELSNDKDIIMVETLPGFVCFPGHDWFNWYEGGRVKQNTKHIIYSHFIWQCWILIGQKVLIVPCNSSSLDRNLCYVFIIKF